MAWHTIVCARTRPIFSTRLGLTVYVWYITDTHYALPCLRQYDVENTGWARSVLGWVTAWEYRVQQTFLFCFVFNVLLSNMAGDARWRPTSCGSGIFYFGMDVTGCRGVRDLYPSWGEKDDFTNSGKSITKLNTGELGINNCDLIWEKGPYCTLPCTKVPFSQITSHILNPTCGGGMLANSRWETLRYQTTPPPLKNDHSIEIKIQMVLLVQFV